MITTAALVTLMVTVPGGSYLPFFSPDKKAVKVDAFQIDAFPVTNQQFLAFVRANPDWRKSKIKKLFADSHYLETWSADLKLSDVRSRKSPVTQTSWFAASAYCKSQGKELPTVDQWEYAASEGGKVNASTTSKILEWYSRPTPKLLPPIDSAPKNEFGIAGLHGLVWEWTRDFNSQVDAGSDESFCGNGGKDARDPSDYAAFMRYSFRNSLKANYSTANLGFRCVKEVREAADSVYNLSSSWTNQDGQRMQISQLKGKPVVLAMVYTSCPVACPMTISEMKAIENAIPEAQRSQVRFAVFSFDSERDTARKLKSYSVKRGLEPATWTLMTGSPSDVRDLAAVLGLKYKRDAKGGFAHSNLITILDAHGVIRKQRSGFGGGPEEMTAELSQLLLP